MLGRDRVPVCSTDESLLTGEEIRGIDVTGRWDIVITQGDQTGVKLEYDSTLTEKYNVTCELDGTTVYLNVENKDGSPNIEGPVMAYAYVTLSSLDKFRCSEGLAKLRRKIRLPPTIAISILWERVTLRMSP